LIAAIAKALAPLTEADLALAKFRADNFKRALSRTYSREKKAAKQPAVVYKFPGSKENP